MEKISAKSIMCAVPALLFLLQLLSGLVGAVDIHFYNTTNGCSGSGYAFLNVGPNVCCDVSANRGGSVLVTNTSGNSFGSQFYRGGGCKSLVATEKGDICVEGGQFTGAKWEVSKRRSLLGSSSCHSTTKPNGVVYTDDGTKGKWILTTSEAADLYSQMMQNIPEAEKANWLQAQGAAYYKL